MSLLLFSKSLTSVKISSYEFTSNRNSKVLTQLPFELKLEMPPTDKGKRGYSDKLVANLYRPHK